MEPPEIPGRFRHQAGAAGPWAGESLLVWRLDAVSDMIRGANSGSR